MKGTPTSAASPISQEALNSLLITAAGNPRGEAQDENGLTQTVAQLLAQGASVNAERSNGATALMIAAKNGHTEIVSVLLAQGADANARASNGFTALMIAAKNGHTEIVDKLLAQGADVNARAFFGLTALRIAAQNGHTEIVDKLLAQGADVNARASFGFTALMFAVKNGHTEIVSKLLAQGVDVNVVRKSNGATALMFAAENGDAGIVAQLLDRGANVNAVKSNGATALMFSVKNGHTETVDKLLAQGADVNTKRSDGVTALMFAAGKGHTEIVDKLLAQGADVNARASDGFTALMFAARDGHTETVAELLDRGANVNAERSNGATALMFAAQNGHTEIVSVLLAQGANVNAERSNGTTALMFAAQNGHTEIVSVLLAQGADVNAKTSVGITALRIAAQNGHTEIASTLLKTLSKNTDEEVRKLVDKAILSMAQTPSTKKVFATEETKTALLKILSKTTDERVKEGLRPLITDTTILIPQLKLEAAIESYKTINPDQSVPRPRAIKTLLDRFLTEKIDQRGESQQEPIEEALEKIANSTKPVLEAFFQEPNYLKWADEIAKAYALAGCVNQPVRGWQEISAWLSIAQALDTIDKIKASKHLMVLDKMDYVTKKLVKESNSGMARVEVEAGNALFRQVHKKLLLNKDISEPWPGVPNLIAYEGTITTWLTKKRIEEAYEEAKATLRQKPKEVASYLARSHHSGTWGLVAFPKELEEIDKKYVEKMELLSGDDEAQISLVKEKEVTVIQTIIDLSEAPFKARSKGAQAAEEVVTPRGMPSSPSSESLSGNEKGASKEGRGGSSCVIS